jgi:type IV fimbrial biogenesis protein FimT
VRTRGFSAIELLAVLAILAVVLGLGAPLWSGWLERLRTQEAAQAFERALIQARSEALTRGQRVVVAPCEGGWSSGWRVFIDDNQNATREDGEAELARYENADRVRIDADFGERWDGRIVFLPGGYVRAADGAPVAGRMSFGESAGVRSVCLSALGRAQRVQVGVCPG